MVDATMMTFTLPLHLWYWLPSGMTSTQCRYQLRFDIKLFINNPHDADAEGEEQGKKKNKTELPKISLLRDR